MLENSEKKDKRKMIEHELSRDTHISIITLLNNLLEYADEMRASDIHIEPSPKNTRVRLRIDGTLTDTFYFPTKIHSEIVSRIKIVSKLRTDEHQATQDGRFRYIIGETLRYIDIRVSIVPTYHGENIVLRILSDCAESFTLQNLGFNARDTQKIMSALKHPSGMILATGPTGSGKTTTLYTLIKILNQPEISIVTIEDPVEYAIEGIKQIQINPRSGLTFGNGLRSILRQDPNVIMVGEIRDSETARIAVNTALTGHLLLSTLHTSDAATTLPRLLDMGIEEYLVGSTVSIVIGQRLVRKICTHCKIQLHITQTERQIILTSTYGKYFNKDFTLYKGGGCTMCSGSGYLGRISVHEVLVADKDVREAILRKDSALTIKNIAIQNGMTDMLCNGISKTMQGITTLEEVLRVISD